MQSTKSPEGTYTDSHVVAGRAPMLAQGTAGQTRFTHSSGGGFCTVCGTVWPCPQSGKRDEDVPGQP